MWGDGVDGGDGGSECDGEATRIDIREGLSIEDPVGVGDRVGGGVRGDEVDEAWLAWTKLACFGEVADCNDITCFGFLAWRVRMCLWSLVLLSNL